MFNKKAILALLVSTFIVAGKLDARYIKKENVREYVSELVEELFDAENAKTAKISDNIYASINSEFGDQRRYNSEDLRETLLTALRNSIQLEAESKARQIVSSSYDYRKLNETKKSELITKVGKKISRQLDEIISEEDNLNGQFADYLGSELEHSVKSILKKEFAATKSKRFDRTSITDKRLVSRRIIEPTYVEEVIERPVRVVRQRVCRPTTVVRYVEPVPVVNTYVQARPFRNSRFSLGLGFSI